MYGLIAFMVVFIAIIGRLLVWPVVKYFLDPKGLRKYPGMTPLSGISNIPFMIKASGGYRCGRLAELHKIHPVIRTGPNSLSYGHLHAIKDIYGHGTKCFKDDFYDVLSGTHFNVADVVDKHEHQRKRKVLSAAYAIKNLESWEFKVVDKVERLIKQFDARCTLPLKAGTMPIPEELNVEFRAWANFFTMEAIVDIGMSNILGFLDRGDDDTKAEGLDGKIQTAHYREAIHSNLTAQSHLVWSYDWFEILQKFAAIFSPKYRKLFRTGKSFDGIVMHQTRERLRRYQDGEKLDDFFQALMESKDGTPNHLPFGEIFAEMSVMLNAGSVTTAIAITNVIYLLLRHPDALEKLRNEIDSVVDEDEVVIPFDKLRDLPYLRACLDESLRLFPPTTFGLPRKTPPEGCTILGEFVPGNTSVSISSYVAHRDERVFPDAEAFIPERWLGEEGKKLQPYFITFSAGARGCIGRNISYLEQTVLVASLVRRYEMALPSPDWRLERVEHFNLVPEGMPMKIWRRTGF
ncbi:cytochrome P450 [Ilyonectria robusta]|uniref:cytochrome P450 n=1 Tax=Ilyonectria robusta TaxID=1079257 RepID=UPI001E8E5FF3|nr:cytochrome P450 [Ilyonectria robusta]KAH8663900.1 cytochrome P450 [Ilyonectria robusta]